MENEMKENLKYKCISELSYNGYLLDDTNYYFIRVQY